MEEYAEEDKRNDTVLAQLSNLPPVLTNLYYLKEKRNEVNHPEESPTPREARRTLFIVASTINEIYQVLKEDTEHFTISSDAEGFQSSFETDTPPLREEISGDAIDVLEITRELSEDHPDGVSKNLITQHTEELEMSGFEIEEAIYELLMSGKVYEPKDETIKII